MKNKILDFIMNNITKYNNYNDVKLKEIRYGLESLYLSISKVIIILIISIFIHTTKYLCLFFITFGLLRLVAFGLHTNKTIECWIGSLSIFTLIPYLIKDNIMINYTLSIILLIIICIYAPSDTKKRPLINKKKRLIYKVLSIILSIIYIIIIFTTNNLIFKNTLFFSLLLESILILPTSYKLLGLTYNNYTSYKRKEDRNESSN